MQRFLAMFPVQASTHAAEVDHMTILVHWLMLVLFIGWGLFFLFVLFRFRKGANPKASYTGAHGKFAKSTEVAVALIEIVAAGLLRHPGVGHARQSVSVRERGGGRRRPRGRPSICLGDPVSRSRREVRPDRSEAGDGGQ